MAQPTFEQTYPQAPFAELIRLGIALAKAWARWRGRAESADAGMSASPRAS